MNIAPIAILLGLLLSSLIGASLGAQKRRRSLGAGLGLLFGPLGWVLVLLMQPDGDKCNACKGVLEPGATVCRHCGRDVVIVRVRPGPREYEPMPDPDAVVPPAPTLRQTTRKMRE